jgi:predicted ABC-type ATPase
LSLSEDDCPLEDLMEQGQPKPQFVMLAGPSGSGKTTFVKNNPDLQESIPHLVTPDVFQGRFAGLPEQESRAKCVELANAQRNELIESRESFMQETLLSSEDRVHELVRMKERGYQTTLIYMCLEDPRMNEGRVRHRIETGGNFVPQEIIARDYDRSLGNLPKALLMADKARLYDNSKGDSPHKLLVTVEQGIATEHVERMPGWVERAFPDGVQAHLDAHQARQQEQQEQQSQARQRRRPDLGLG